MRDALFYENIIAISSGCFHDSPETVYGLEALCLDVLESGSADIRSRMYVLVLCE